MMKDNKKRQDEAKVKKKIFEQTANSLELEGEKRTLARLVFKIAWSASRKYHLNQ